MHDYGHHVIVMLWTIRFKGGKNGRFPEKGRSPMNAPSVAAQRPPDARARVVERDPEATRANILAIATEELAEKGFSGARVDDIAARTDTSKRMIYYYFGDKEGLFVAVIERAYAGIRQIEANLKLDRS